MNATVLLHLPLAQLLMMSCLLVLVARQRCTSGLIVASLIWFLCCRHNAAGFIMKPSRDHCWLLIRVKLFFFFFLSFQELSIGLPIIDGGHAVIGRCLLFLFHLKELHRSTLCCSFLSSFYLWSQKILHLERGLFLSYPERNFLIISSADRLQRCKSSTTRLPDLA